MTRRRSTRRLARKDARALDHEALCAAVQAMLDKITAKSRHLERVLVRTNGRIRFLRTEEIDWIRAEGNYVSLRVAQASHLLRMSVGSLEPQLDPRQFRRIHRSLIVNLDRVRELHAFSKDGYQVVLLDGTELPLGRSYRDHLLDGMTGLRISA